jgi:hypothetical protein
MPWKNPEGKTSTREIFYYELTEISEFTTIISSNKYTVLISKTMPNTTLKIVPRLLENCVAFLYDPVQSAQQ